MTEVDARREKRSVRGTSHIGRVLRQSCSVRDHFVSIGILPNVHSTKMNLFPHNKVEEQPSKKLRATAQWVQKWIEVVYHKIQMHSFLKVESLGETRCRKSWNQSKGYHLGQNDYRFDAVQIYFFELKWICNICNSMRFKFFELNLNCNGKILSQDIFL